MTKQEEDSGVISPEAESKSREIQIFSELETGASESEEMLRLRLQYKHLLDVGFFFANFSYRLSIATLLSQDTEAIIAKRVDDRTKQFEASLDKLKIELKQATTENSILSRQFSVGCSSSVSLPWSHISGLQDAKHELEDVTALKNKFEVSCPEVHAMITEVLDACTDGIEAAAAGFQ